MYHHAQPSGHLLNSALLGSHMILDPHMALAEDSLALSHIPIVPHSARTVVRTALKQDELT